MNHVTISHLRLRLSPSWISAFLLTVTCVAPAQPAGDLPFSSGSTGADGPLQVPPTAAIIGTPTLAFDADRGEALAFAENGHLWKWDATSWQRVLSATNPSPRGHSAMAYDEARRNLILFGGSGTGNQETWIWDGTNWVERTATLTSAPSGRHGHAMVYDSVRREVLLVGGIVGSSETWSWNGTAWRQHALLPVNPGPYPGLSFDRERGRAVLFGGEAGRRETWEWDGTNWFNRTEAIVTDANTPRARLAHGMTYDSARRRTLIFSGTAGANDLWEWNGIQWLERTPQPSTLFNSPLARNWTRLIHDSTRQQVLMLDTSSAETWRWNGVRWTMWNGPTFYLDVADRPDGIWHYTTISVAPSILVKFNRNAANTPVRWLASGDVRIDGILDLNGENGPATTAASGIALGGPGGFAGGRGALALNQSSSAVGSPGDGPGGGNPGVPGSIQGENALHASAYGNPYLQPLIGGSGGGGGASTETQSGGSGGAGGGAILIASSRDIVVSGEVRASGGSGSGGASAGGHGSGGAIFLKADRISGNGTLRATGAGLPGTEGRIRLEAYYRQLAGSTVPTSVNSLPVLDQSVTNNARLRIVSIDGVAVPLSPGGNALVPDVIFTNLNPVTIQVAANAIPNNTAVRLRVTTSSGVVLATNTLIGTATTFSLPIPPGIGSVQAFAEFTLGN